MTNTGVVKIIDLLNRPRSEGDKIAVSLEYFPPRSAEGVENLKSRMTRLQRLVRPLFCDVTWGAGGSTSDLSLDLALHLQQESQNINTNSNKSYSCGMANLHMTCTNMMNSEHPADDLRKVVQLAMAGGIANIVALRGDPPAGGAGGETTTTNSEFECALDLVRFLRQEFDAAALGLSVAGYPEGHPVAITPVDTETDPLTDRELARSSTDLTTGQVYTCREAAYEAELAYLKQKVDAGADFIITQMFFDTQVYIQFVKDCRAAGILCPVVPGIMCLTGKAGFYKMAQFCKTRVPPELAERVAACTTDDDVKALGIRWGTQQCRDMMAIPEKELVPSVLHFYTLNLEKVVLGILGELGLVEKNDGNHAGHDDATAGVAAGSAWARIGDAVDSVYGRGTVVEFVQETAVIRIDSWKLAGDQAPIAYLQNGHYHKVVFSN